MVVVLAVAAAIPAIAFAWSWFPYAQGKGGVNGQYSTIGYGPREGNRVYHELGYTWELWYQHVGGGISPVTYGSANPLVWSYNGHSDDSYAKSWCSNVNDNSGTTWTCQSTNP